MTILLVFILIITLFWAASYSTNQMFSTKPKNKFKKFLNKFLTDPL